MIARRRLLAAAAGAGLIAGSSAQTQREQDSGYVGDAPWVPTPDDMIDVMFGLAGVGPRDVVCDLGSGDGRIPIAAAKRRGARGIGVEIDPELIAGAWRNARAAGVADRVRFVQGDLFAADLSPATVITLYLMTNMNDRLRPKLYALAPGTRIVAHNFGMNEWDADEVAFHNETRALLWIVPARVAGSWSVTFDGASDRITLSLVQSFQRLSGETFHGNVRHALRDAEVRGDRVRFAVTDPRQRVWTFHGRAAGGRLLGLATDGVVTRRFAAVRQG